MKVYNTPQKALDGFPCALVIITAGSDKEKAGMTASWNTQVSWKPPYIGIAIYYRWRTLELILKYKEFAVHLVSEDLIKPALKVFGALSSRKIDKFELAKREFNLKIDKGKEISAPVIYDAPLVLECKLKEYHVIGDHYLVIGDPIKVYRNNDKRPVIYLENKIFRVGGIMEGK